MKSFKLKGEMLEFIGVISRRELKRNPKLRRMLKNLRKNLVMLTETEGVTGRATMIKYLDGKALLQN